MDKDSVRQLLDSIASIGAAYLSNPNPTPGLRLQLLAQVQSLANELADPVSTLLWLSWAEPARRAAIITALDLDLFSFLSSPTHVSDLAARTGAAPQLLRRLLRHLAATSVVRETALDTYAATQLSQLLCDPRHAAAIRFSAALPTPVFADLPDFLRKINYADPQQETRTPFQYVMRTEKSPWEWAGEQPELAGIFALHMSGYHASAASWMDPEFYPVQERLIDECRQGEHEVLLVDVGGGLGHDLEEFKAKHAHAIQGRRLVLQDLKVMVKAAKALRPWIEAQASNFFQKQSVEGARAYLLHSVLHDWRDVEAVRILRNIREAMHVKYSKILIYEHIIPREGASWRATANDLILMGTGSEERTEEHWKQLIKAAGLRVEAIWTKDPGSQSLMEVTLEAKANL